MYIKIQFETTHAQVNITVYCNVSVLIFFDIVHIQGIPVYGTLLDLPYFTRCYIFAYLVYMERCIPTVGKRTHCYIIHVVHSLQHIISKLIHIFCSVIRYSGLRVVMLLLHNTHFTERYNELI